MPSFIVGKKLNMSQVFLENGEIVPVTVIKAAPVKVSKVKTSDGKDKYSAIQIEVSNKIAGSKKHNKFEFRQADTSNYESGQQLDVSSFQVGDLVNVVGIMKGRGFTGAIKRHGFAGFPASHGHDRPRSVGSIGQRYPQHTRKGLRMAGHYGNSQITVKNLQVVEVDSAKHLIALKGAVPGHRNAVVKIVSTGKQKPLFKAEQVTEDKKKK